MKQVWSASSKMSTFLTRPPKKNNYINLINLHYTIIYIILLYGNVVLQRIAEKVMFYTGIC